jgi:hypothetical protein
MRVVHMRNACWPPLAIVGPYWPLLAMVGNGWTRLDVVSHCWPLLVIVDSCGLMLVTVKQCWPVLVVAGQGYRCGKLLLATAGHVVAMAGHSWSALASAGPLDCCFHVASSCVCQLEYREQIYRVNCVACH